MNPITLLIGIVLIINNIHLILMSSYFVCLSFIINSIVTEKARAASLDYFIGNKIETWRIPEDDVNIPVSGLTALMRDSSNIHVLHNSCLEYLQPFTDDPPEKHLFLK